MKKLILVAAVAMIGAVVLPSCKKDYTCVCTFDDLNGQSQSVEAPMNNVKKSDAKNACSSLSSTYSMYTSVECKLK